MESHLFNLATSLFSRRYNVDRPGLCRIGASTFLDAILPVLIPPLGDRKFRTAEELGLTLAKLQDQLTEIIACLLPEGSTERSEGLARKWFESLESLEQQMEQDAAYIESGDPAANSIDEVMLCYPGFYAIAVYRLANALFNLDVPYLPRLLSEIAHDRTGIDIHPGATIGCPLCIDHGTGIVVGETTTIGKRVKLYQGVTLGALSVSKTSAQKKRHPTIADDCVIYSNATILGGETSIGTGAIIGGNVWVTKSVPAGARVFYKATHMEKKN